MASAGHPAPVRLGRGVCALIEPVRTAPWEPSRPSSGHGVVDSHPVRRSSSTRMASPRRADDGELFGEQRLIETLCSTADNRPSALVKRLLDAVSSFAGELRDDLQSSRCDGTPRDS